MYGEGAVTDRTRQKWSVKFHARDVLLCDAPWSGGRVELYSNQIKTLTENNQYYITRKIAIILKISKSIKLLFKIKTVSLFYRKKLKLFG